MLLHQVFEIGYVAHACSTFPSARVTLAHSSHLQLAAPMWDSAGPEVKNPHSLPTLSPFCPPHTCSNLPH